MSPLLAAPRIFLIDDEPLVLEMFEAALLRAGYQVSTANGAMSARYQLKTAFFDLLLSDVRLDEGTGFELAELARVINPKIHLILITGAPNESDQLRAKKLGALYLSKPITIPQLLTAISNLLQSSDKQLGNG